MNIPAGVATTLVKGTFLKAVLDTADAGREPDAIPLAGAKVRLTPSVDHVRYSGATAVILALAEIPLTLDAAGVLRDQAGQEGVTLVASDQAAGDPALWTWTARVIHPAVAPFVHQFVAPTGGVVDLSSVRAVPSQPVAELAGWQYAITEAERIIESGRHLYYPQIDVTGDVHLAAIDRNAIIHWRLTGNVTITALPLAPLPGQTITIVHQQDGTGGRTLTIKGAYASQGLAPVATASPNTVDVTHLWHDGVRWIVAPANTALSIPASWVV
ncbi:MAG: hypothetical protein KIT69_11375 [Propionibacteriaceae bacterium]|nr:hypothetical protein [Propionibacteriaceae bacterium]